MDLDFRDASDVKTAPLVVLGLAGGFLVARETGIRTLGGALLAAAGVFAGRTWLRKRGPLVTGGLSAGYLAAFGLSHPLAKKIGAWPSVAVVTSAAALAAHFAADHDR